MLTLGIEAIIAYQEFIKLMKFIKLSSLLNELLCLWIATAFIAAFEDAININTWRLAVGERLRMYHAEPEFNTQQTLTQIIRSCCCEDYCYGFLSF